MQTNKTQYLKIFALILTITLALTSSSLLEAANEQPTRPLFRTRSAALRQQQQSPQVNQTGTGTGSAVEVPAPSINKPLIQTPASQSQAQPQANRTVRTADVFQNGDGYNIFVTNTCERESMKVNIKTSRPFYGVIHTRNQRNKQICTTEGNGDTDYNLEISHVLNQQDPAYCGAIKARKDSPESKDTISVVVAVRVHRNIELSDDKFFLLNCTNRCRKPDCSSPSARLLDSDDTSGAIRNEGDETERESTNGASVSGNRTNIEDDECTIWKFPWVITLLWCLGILLLAMIISHCIMCSSMICKCVKTEIEEREPSVYEGATDDDDDLYNKRHPYRIDYDNKDIYKTNNNYKPYELEETQAKSRSKHRNTTR